MKLYSITKNTVRAYVIAYFARGRRMPTPGMNIRTAYGYSDRAWAEVANDLNKYGWMDQLGALLTADEMGPLKTVDDIVNLIWSKRSTNKKTKKKRTAKTVRTARVPRTRRRTTEARRKPAARRKTAARKKSASAPRKARARTGAARGHR
jgi:hypothetical protein